MSLSLERRTRLVLMAVFCAAGAMAQTPPPGTPPAPAANQATQNPALPEAPYVPLSTGQKFHTFAKQTYSPYTFFSAGFNALYAQAWGDPHEYGGGMQGYVKRVGSSLANTEASRFFNRFLFPSMFGQDPRYFPAKRNLALGRRAFYAASRVLITRGDSGRSQFNYSEVFGDLCTVSLENAYYPRSERSFGDTLNRFSGALLSTATSNLAREFWPDMRRIFRRHEPRKVLEIEQKLEKKIPSSIMPSRD